MTQDNILTKHPQGKSGKRISRQKYEVVKQAMLEVLQDKELTHTELMSMIQARLTGKFNDNISWYAETVKLDLEARNIVERTASKPQHYRLKESQ